MLIQQIVAYLLAGVLVTGGTSVTDIQDVPQDQWYSAEMTWPDSAA